MNCKDMETQAVCLKAADGSQVSAIAHFEYGLDVSAVMLSASTRFTDASGQVVYDPTDFIDFTVGVCELNRSYVDTCFLPDQYAIQWAWAGNGQLQSYDPSTEQWTEYGETIDPATGLVVGGYALAFKNDTVNPRLYFQSSGSLYQASPNDPIGTFSFVGPTLPDAPGSYPCFAFDLSGRLLAGIGSGSTVIEINTDTGVAINIGPLIDARDGSILAVSPGDWYFDPNGDWYMMASDNRGSLFGACTGTALWKIDPSTLLAVRVSDTCSPQNGTGAEWFNAGVALLSQSDGGLVEYNLNSDEWQPFPNPAPQGINDLASQWVIPDPIRVTGFVDIGSATEDCTSTLSIIEMDPVTQEIVCRPFDVTLPGQFGKCETEPNPFVSDPFSPSDNESGGKNPDQVWNEGCSDAGTTMFRTTCDESGNEFTEYLYGSLQQATPLKPSNFAPVACDISEAVQTETTEWCNLDNDPSTSVFRKESSDGTVVWYDDTGTIPEPVNKEPGDCEGTSSLLPVTEQVICHNGVTYVRSVRERYVENAQGLPQLQDYEVVWFNEDGTFYDSGTVLASEEANEPSPYYLGDCVDRYRSIEFHKLCEVDARFLLLIDSGGEFARYSFYTKKWSPVNITGVTSAGGAADVANFRLYNFIDIDTLTVVDVSTDTRLPDITLTSGVLKPGETSNPLTFSAASFRNLDGGLYAWDVDSIYRVNVQTGVVDFVTDVTGVVGSGISIAIDNTTDTLILNGTDLSYQVDWVTGVGTVWGNPPIQPNGSTFDTDGNFYVTQFNDTYSLAAGLNPNDTSNYVRIIDDWTPGANSMAYYEVVAAQPSCFYRKFGILADPLADPEYISDHSVSDFSQRTIVGDVDCCECACGSDAPSGGSVEMTHLIEGCVTVGGVKVSAYTIVNNNGNSLFPPRPLTDLGFDADCCE